MRRFGIQLQRAADLVKRWRGRVHELVKVSRAPPLAMSQLAPTRRVSMSGLRATLQHSTLLLCCDHRPLVPRSWLAWRESVQVRRTC